MIFATILELMNLVNEATMFGGATAEFQREYARRLGQISEAFCMEQKLDPNRIRLENIDHGTELGPESRQHLRDLDEWLRLQIPNWKRITTDDPLPMPYRSPIRVA